MACGFEIDPLNMHAQPFNRARDVAFKSETSSSSLYEPCLEKTCFVLCKQQRRRSAYASAQSDQHLCYSLLRYYNICSCYVLNFKTLASF